VRFGFIVVCPEGRAGREILAGVVGRFADCDVMEASWVTSYSHGAMDILVIYHV
jgi:hypothetical protein